MIAIEARKVALVTGASTGIGLATAKKLMKVGYFVVATARASSMSRFESVAFPADPSEHWLRPLDVTNAAERREVVDEIEQKLGRLDVLINNAGVIYRTPLEYAYEFEGKDQMAVNFHSPLELIKLALPIMRRNGSGHIVNISSAAGLFSVPTMGLYAASKHALEGASEALYHELRPWNIHVSIVQPGFVSSEAYEKTRLGLVMERRKKEPEMAYHSQSRMISALVENALKLTTTTADDVAGSICKVVQMNNPPLRQTVTLDAQVFGFLKRFLPDAAFETLVGYCLRKICEQTDLLSKHARSEIPRGPLIGPRSTDPLTR